jgi:hypothetical protein
MRPQREVFVIAGERTDAVSGAINPLLDRRTARIIALARRGAPVGGRKPVIRIRPGSRQLRILPSGADPRGEVRKLVAAALADGGERDRIPR